MYAKLQLFLYKFHIEQTSFLYHEYIYIYIFLVIYYHYLDILIYFIVTFCIALCIFKYVVFSYP